MIRLENNTMFGSAWAVFSDDRHYRFELGRIWDADLPPCCGVFMNPSTADHEWLDPTTVRFETRCQRLGFGGFIVVNIHAFVETKQNEIRTVDDPIGENNDETILSAALRSSMVLLGYGANQWSRKRADHVSAMLLDACPEKIHVLRLTKGGQPEHPLYIPYDQKPVRLER